MNSEHGPLLRLVVGELGTNCYVILPADGADAVVIDPGAEGARVKGVLRDHRLRLSGVVLTHGHIDHLLGLADLLADESEVEVYLHPGDGPLIERMDFQAEFFGVPTPALPRHMRDVADGDILCFGGRSFRIIHTPGHSPGSICLLFEEEKTLVSGDTVFLDGVGRTDLWGGSSTELRSSIEERLLVLDQGIVVYPGHGERTTLGDVSAFMRESVW